MFDGRLREKAGKAEKWRKAGTEMADGVPGSHEAVGKAKPENEVTEGIDIVQRWDEG